MTIEEKIKYYKHIHETSSDPQERKRAYIRYYQLSRRDKVNAIAKKTYHKNKEKYKERIYKYNNLNKESKAEYQKAYRESHVEDRAAYQREYRHEHPEKYGSSYGAYGIAKKQRTLFNQKQELEEIYINCPDDKVVDHILPLRGKNVSGLHVPWNLQYITEKENNSKLHKFDGTYNNETWKNKK